VSLRTNPVERLATLPDGTVVRVRVGVAEDSYIASRDLDTVTVELAADVGHLAAVTTVIGLESGTLAPTAHALEPLADSLR
jgi:hypothetical protein